MNAPLSNSQPTSVDYRLYRDPAIYAAEQERIFRGPTWCYLGLEAEIPNPGDFRSTFVGETPVVLTRSRTGALCAWVNQCAHKGALVCRTPRGHMADQTFVCVYHQWAYDASGDLLGVPFQRGLQGVGGYPGSFDKAAHGLRKLRVDSIAGMVFGTFSDAAPPLETFLGEEMCGNIRRIFSRPIKILGYARQHMRGNWKLYSENSRDGYHGGLLHLFYPTFGIYRQSQESRGVVDAQGFHNHFTVSKPRGDINYDNFGKEANRQLQESVTLQDPRVIEFRPDFNDGIGLSIQSLFPSVVLQQIQNTLATRQVLPRGIDRTELMWTYFGFADDTPEMDKHRLRNINLVGPAGLISMEDGEAVEICQAGIAGGGEDRSFVALGGDGIDPAVSPIGMDENGVRGFWKGYIAIMNGSNAPSR